VLRAPVCQLLSLAAVTHLRALSLTLLGCLTLAGCGVEPAATSVQREALGSSWPGTADVPGYTCFPAFDVVPGESQTDDPWPAGTRGYVMVNPLTFARTSHAENVNTVWVASGLDVTMTQEIWTRTYATQNEATATRIWPEGKALVCPRQIIMGEPTTGGTVDTGNNNDPGGLPQGKVCYANQDLDHVRTTCPCQPFSAALACGGASCGPPASNGCGGTVSCGTCRAGFTCDGSECLCNKTCPKGYHLGDGTCMCIKGKIE
jgi:hypothetical protein